MASGKIPCMVLHREKDFVFATRSGGTVMVSYYSPPSLSLMDSLKFERDREYFGIFHRSMINMIWQVRERVEEWGFDVDGIF